MGQLRDIAQSVDNLSELPTSHKLRLYDKPFKKYSGGGLSGVTKMTEN